MVLFHNEEDLTIPIIAPQLLQMEKTAKQLTKRCFEKGQNRKGNFNLCFTLNEQYFQEIAKTYRC